MKKPLPTSFLVPLWRFGWADALWGVENGWAEPDLLVELAIQQLLSGEATSPQVTLLAGLSPSQGYDAVSLAEELVCHEPHSDDHPAMNWLYMALRWLYDNRAARRDPLGDIEEIYCDFGHPARIQQLVRYMPPQGYDPSEFTRAENEQRLFQLWDRFLRGEELRFVR